jgi:glutathione-regulated potassium-efflux system ancillary protein KefC
MTGVWALAALWLGLALVASLLSIWFRISTALSEIVVGTIAQLIIGAAIGSAVLGTDESWVKFLSGIGAIVLTFLAGAELDPAIFRLKWKEAAAVGLASFFFPFLGCAAAAHYLLGWEVMPSWLAGVAMSTTSVAVVYAVMIEFGFNTTEYGKTVLAACFITDLGTVVALGLIFAPFTMKTMVSSASARRSLSSCPGSRLASSGCTEAGPRNWRPSSCFSACLGWARSQPGLTARPCFLHISLGWCLQAL